MRLGQLARKLATRPAEIVEFLGQMQIQIEDGFNIRLADEHVDLIIKEFGKDITGDVQPPAVTPNNPTQEQETIQPGDEDQTMDVALESDAAEVQKDVQQIERTEATELIKAPKVELSGLKVLGKIDLPEPKKIVATSEPEEPQENEVQKPMKPSRPLTPDFKKHQHTQRPKKNPLALKREREAREQQRKQEEQAAAEKERKTRNYHKRVKMSPPTKAIRMVDEPLMQMTEEELREPPKTWVGKLIRWLTNA